MLRVLHELHTTMKTYHAYQGEFRQAENKLRLAENQRLKLEASIPKEKLERSKKYRLIEKEVQKVSKNDNDKSAIELKESLTTISGGPRIVLVCYRRGHSPRR